VTQIQAARLLENGHDSDTPQTIKMAPHGNAPDRALSFGGAQHDQQDTAR